MTVFIFFILVGIALFYFARKQENRLMRIFGISLFALGLLLLIAKWSGWISSEDGINVQTTKVQKRTIVQTVSASGKIQPEVEVKISPDVSGEIVQLDIKEGIQVEKGDLLLKIKPDTYQSILERSQAALNTSKSALAKAKAQLIESESNFNRNKSLYENGTISKSEFERIQASYTVTQLNVEDGEYAVTSAQASLREAQENLNKTNIYAPISGTISRLNVELGERVVGTAQMAGTELLRLANLNLMEVAVEVNENDINSVNLGDTALIEVDAFLGEKYKGLVSEIANSADITGSSADQVTNFGVKVRIIDSVSFRPGMTATVDIQSEYVKDVLSLPIQAVTTRYDAKGEDKLECVFEVQGASVKMVEVKTGIQDEEYIQILSGVSDSMSVVKGPYSAVSRLLNDGSYIVNDESSSSKGSVISF